MFKASENIVTLFKNLTLAQQYNYSRRQRKIPTLHQRLKKYGKMPEKYQRVTLIRPPNLQDQNIQFPLRIPIRYRHIYKPQKPLFIDDTKNIKWQRLTPNEILLAFENSQYLTHQEIIQGLRYLSKVQGQEQHNWNQHPWISKVFQYINSQFDRIKVSEMMGYYKLMKKLGCKHKEFWSKLYTKIEENIYDVSPSDFQYLFLTYYKKATQVFSEQMPAKMLKLMQGRLREFKNESVLTIFQIFHEEGRLNQYWLESVFVPLFKQPTRKYTIEQIGQIFRFMMIVGHQHNDRLYDSLYSRILSYEYQSKNQAEFIEEIIQEVKEIFTSHRVQPKLVYLREQKEKLTDQKEQKKLQLHQIVKQDLIFFMEKRKIQQQVQKTAAH